MERRGISSRVNAQPETGGMTQGGPMPGWTAFLLGLMLLLGFSGLLVAALATIKPWGLHGVDAGAWRSVSS